ncbi:hypothetical protein SAMN05216239_0462 [Bacillus amyloliquefaciens]|nr:hypothetical protein MY7_1156 [Bacillus sp. 5B6]SIQ13385.1 hypothetical protein SAMN05216239_0462 [Bacillus amyloliquefaciens]
MDFLYTDETSGLDQPYDLVYKGGYIHMKQTGLLLVVTGLILLQLSIQLPQQNAAWGMTLGASILLNLSGTGLIMRSLHTQTGRR